MNKFSYEDKIKILEALKRPGLHKEAVNEYLDAIIQDLLELEAIDEGK